MASQVDLQNNSPDVLNHRLNQFFPELLEFESIEAMEKSAVYRKIKSEVEAILNAVVQENFAPAAMESADVVRALAWNIERGNRFEGIVAALKNHERIKR